MKAISKILCEVDCKYGAPMGRYSTGTQTPPIHKKLFDRAVNLTEGYDKGGAYWGHGDPLRVRYTKDLTYVDFYRVNRNDCTYIGANVFLFKEKVITKCIDVFDKGDIRTEWSGVRLKGEYQAID